MPPSGCSQLIIVLLAQSVAKVNSKGKKGENQEETENLIPSEGEGVASSQIEDSENRDPTRKGTDVKSKDNWGEPKGKTFDQLKEDLIKSVVYNHLKKVSPKLAKKFAFQFTFVEGSVKLESVVDFSYKKLVNLIKEYDNENQNFEVSKDKTPRIEVLQGGLKPRCDECNMSFFNNATLKRHNLVHTRDKPHICDICNKAFSRAGHLKIHKLTHYVEKRHSCYICNLSLSQDCFLEHNRKWIWSQEQDRSRKKPHSCIICSKSFTQPSDLKRHTLVHSKEKPFSCNMCSKSFSQAGNLKQHKRMHSGVKPYTCDICGKSFFQAIQLKSHNLVHNKPGC